MYCTLQCTLSGKAQFYLCVCAILQKSTLQEMGGKNHIKLSLFCLINILHILQGGKVEKGLYNIFYFLFISRELFPVSATEIMAQCDLSET